MSLKARLIIFAEMVKSKFPLATPHSHRLIKRLLVIYVTEFEIFGAQPCDARGAVAAP